MEEQHQLKYHGKFSIFEQAVMTAEERSWHVKRLKREFEEQAEREKKQTSTFKRPSMPRRR